MIAWLAMGLHGCAWIGAEQHQDALVDAWGLSVLDVLRVDACEGSVAQILTSVPLPEGTTVTWSFIDVEGTDTLRADPDDPRISTFIIEQGELLGACTSMVEGCVGDLKVDLVTPQTPLTARGRMQIEPTPALPPLRLTSNAPLTGDVLIAESPTLEVPLTNGYDLSLLACPVGAPEEACLTAAFDEDLRLATSLLDVCPEDPPPGPLALGDWTLTLVGGRPCGDVFGPAIPVRFLNDDCDQDGLSALGGVDCDDLDADAPQLLFPDVDGDGFGGGVAELTCSNGGQWVEDDSDCDDTAATTFPGAIDDTCDGVDQDCSCDFVAAVPGIGQPCQGDDGTAMGGYRDSDEDGWGVQSDPIGNWFCPIAGMSFQVGDCAADDPLVNPGAFEDYSDLVDDDCDGCAHLDSFASLGVSQLLVLTSEAASTLGFDQPPTELVALQATHLTAGHFTGDGFPDLAFVDANGLQLRAGESFQPSTVINGSPGQVRALAAVHLDDDEQIDLVVLTSTHIQAYLGPLTAGQLPSSLALNAFTRLTVPPMDTLEPVQALFVHGGPGAGNEQVLTWDDGWTATPLDAGNPTDATFTPEGELIVARSTGMAIASDVPGPFTEIGGVGSRIALDPDPGGDHRLAVAWSGGIRVTRRASGTWAPIEDITLAGTPVALAWGDFDGDGTRDLGVGTSSFAAGSLANRVLFDVFGATFDQPLSDALVADHAVALDLDGTGGDELALLSLDAVDPDAAASKAYVYAFAAAGPPTDLDVHTGIHGLIRPIPLGVAGAPTTRPECVP